MEDHAWRDGFDVTMENCTEEWACLGLAGPKSREILQKVTSADVSDKAWPFLRARGLDVGGVETHAMRISYTGSVECICHLNMQLTTLNSHSTTSIVAADRSKSNHKILSALFT